MTQTEVVGLSPSSALWETVEAELAAASLTSKLPDVMPMVERVAKVISGMSVIGEARNALDAAGWTATITANRITVDEEVLAQFIPAKIGTFGLINARWIIYSIAGADPVWIVGTDESDGRPAQTITSSEPAADGKAGGLS
jgi:hypothetical protein